MEIFYVWELIEKLPIFIWKNADNFRFCMFFNSKKKLFSSGYLIKRDISEIAPSVTKLCCPNSK